MTDQLKLIAGFKQAKFFTPSNKSFMETIKDFLVAV